ncbi:MAG: hypothetical protein Q8Q09_22620 [Deltaproteobacteria bacterium]|nr:hypothetical protein [Deltaproteobacteria bacterium]
MSRTALSPLAALSTVTTLALALSLSGCAVQRASSARQTLIALEIAARAHDYRAMYSLLPQSARSQESLADFERRMQPNQGELVALGEQTQRTLRGQSPTIAIPTHGGAPVTLTETSEGWRLPHAQFGTGAAVTPHDAARALRTALQRQSLRAVLGALSSRSRGALQSEMAMLVDALEDPASLETRTLSSATGSESIALRLPDGRELILVREGRGWRVDDIH